MNPSSDPPTINLEEDVMEISESDPITPDFHKDSAIFSENVIISRENEHRRHPVFRALPVRNILLIMYRTISTSQHLQPFQLVGLGNMLLTLLRQLQEQKDATESNQGDVEFGKYLGILEILFTRLNHLHSVEEEKNKDIKNFLDCVWELHTSGTLDLSKTTIPATIAKVIPSQLESVLESCILTREQPPLIQLCHQNPENFIKVMELLQIKSIARQDMLEFGKDFQSLLQTKLDADYAKLFPTAFQPLLYFLSQISSLRSSLIQNDIVFREILRLVNALFYQSELFKFNESLVIYILMTNPNVTFSTVLKQASHSSKFLWVRQAMKGRSI